MRKTTLLWAIIFILMALDIYLVNQVRTLRNQPQAPTYNQSQLDFLAENYGKLLNKELYECIDHKSKLNDTTTILDKTGNVLAIKQQFPTIGKYKLVVRISQENCFTCFTYAYNIIKTFAGKIGNNNVLYLGYFDNITTMRTFMESNFGKVTTYDLKQRLNLSVEKLRQPYVFILDENNQMQNVYVINKNNQKQLNEYLAAMQLKYFN